ncbi:SDR family oxidoreductase [Lihuaxuella thermophila]|uniref:UDP-glucose 4-epimerase n=1 Tax=Lihuaxuella thermophila TaxID=1173111 RepID=A0A1H8BA14_9BACL|nr:SDR family oxidoreductase [Lihuaxuella thermophila]SEM78924.1 UDP-glucose 4-epimerase [Lihuaxuella thermophila]
MKVLVTGGAGFIGSHIVDHLIAGGAEVAIVDNISTGKSTQIHPDASFYSMDISSPHLLEVFQKEQPEVVIHQAAQIHVGTSVDDPVFDATTNILGTIRLLEASRQTGVRKIVYASSAAVYGNPEYLPIDEQHPVHPLSGYGVSKYTPEQYLSVYHHLYGLRYTILRYANVYGVRQDPRGEGGVISIFIDKILSNSPLTIFGDGEQTRDYIYVEDVAKANLAAIQNGDGEIFNIGTGVRTSLNQVVQLFNQITGRQNPVEYGPERSGDIKHSYFNNQKARALLFWEPAVTLEEGLKKTYEYYRDEYRKMDKEMLKT